MHAKAQAAPPSHAAATALAAAADVLVAVPVPLSQTVHRAKRRQTEETEETQLPSQAQAQPRVPLPSPRPPPQPHLPLSPPSGLQPKAPRPLSAQSSTRPVVAPRNLGGCAQRTAQQCSVRRGHARGPHPPSRSCRTRAARDPSKLKVGAGGATHSLVSQCPSRWNCRAMPVFLRRGRFDSAPLRSLPWPSACGAPLRSLPSPPACEPLPKPAA